MVHAVPRADAHGVFTARYWLPPVKSTGIAGRFRLAGSDGNPCHAGITPLGRLTCSSSRRWDSLAASRKEYAAGGIWNAMSGYTPFTSAHPL